MLSRGSRRPDRPCAVRRPEASACHLPSRERIAGIAGRVDAFTIGRFWPMVILAPAIFVGFSHTLTKVTAGFHDVSFCVWATV